MSSTHNKTITNEESESIVYLEYLILQKILGKLISNILNKLTYRI